METIVPCQYRLTETHIIIYHHHHLSGLCVTLSRPYQRLNLLVTPTPQNPPSRPFPPSSLDLTAILRSSLMG